MGEKIKESWYSSLPSLYLIRRESGVLRIAMAVNRPVLRVHENLPLALTVAPHQFLPFKFTSVGIRCSPFNDKTLISIKPNTSHLNHDTLACRFHAAQFAGTHFPSLFSTLTFFFILLTSFLSLFLVSTNSHSILPINPQLTNLHTLLYSLHLLIKQLLLLKIFNLNKFTKEHHSSHVLLV